MTNSSNLAMCPINFKEFEQLKCTVGGNIDAALLFSKINFHLTYTKIKKNGVACIARSREDLAAWFGFGLKKIDRLLNFLEEKGLLFKKVGTWYGKKILFIGSLKPTQVPINVGIFSSLINITGSVSESLLISKIAYRFANSQIIMEGKKWCCISQEELASFLRLSKRSVSSKITLLKRRGLIIKKSFSFRGRSRTHFHIPEFVYEMIENKVKSEDSLGSKKVTHSHICTRPSANMTFSIKIRTKKKKTKNNNTASRVINSNKFKQNKTTPYIKRALEKTIEKHSLTVSNFNLLLEEIKFSVSSKEQSRGVTSFKHAVNRAMSILRDRNWKTPIGFLNHCEAGQKVKLYRENQEAQWEKQKSKEMALTHSDFLDNVFRDKQNTDQNRLNDKATAVRLEIEKLKQDAIDQKLSINVADSLIRGKIKVLSILLQQGAKIGKT